MPRTRPIKSSNSQTGDVITIYPASSGMSDVVAALRRMPKPPRVEKRRPIEVPVRQRD